ncbi:MAG: histidine phosphatase family protein [Planctomycetota bacterium]
MLKLYASLLCCSLAVLWLGVSVAASDVAKAPEAAAVPVEATEPADLLRRLRAGGLVIYFRHAQTQKDYADQVTADPNDGSTQRVLSEEGWHQAKGIGEAFRALEIPVGDVISSEYFRAWQTADLAFGKYEKNAALNFEPAEEYTDEQFAAMRERVLPLITAPPNNPATNTVIVGHDDPFEAVTGIYPEPQGVAYVIEPHGDHFHLLARVNYDEWKALDEQD